MHNSPCRRAETSRLPGLSRAPTCCFRSELPKNPGASEPGAQPPPPEKPGWRKAGCPMVGRGKEAGCEKTPGTARERLWKAPGGVMELDRGRHMKKALLLAVAMVLVLHAPAMAQEREPLVMRIELEWTVAGIFAGVAIGFMIWLTDPAGPLPLGEAMASGAAWGALAGAGFGVFTMQRTVRLPMRTVALPPEEAIPGKIQVAAPSLTADVLASVEPAPASAPFPALALAPNRIRLVPPGQRGVSIPLLTLRF